MQLRKCIGNRVTSAGTAPALFRGHARKLALLAMAAAPIGGFFAFPCHGQALTWDASGANPLAPTDGGGNWNTTTNANWSNGAADSTWISGSAAAIGNGGAGGVITIDDISGTVSAAGINFNAVTAP